MTPSTPPAELKQFAEAVQRAGLWLADSEQSQENFGNSVTVFIGPGVRIRTVKERGQWFVEVTGSGWDEWFSPMIWRSIIQGQVVATPTPSFNIQCQMVLDDLDRIREVIAVQPSDEIISRLRLMREERGNLRKRQQAT